MTGRPQAIASIRTIPNDSGGSVVSRRRSAPRSTPGSSACGTGPRKWTRSPTPAAVAWSRKAVEQLAASGDHQVRRRRRLGGRARAFAGDPRQRLDRQVEPLEVVGAVERGDEGRHQRVVRDPEPGAQAGSVRPGREQLRVDAVWHLDQLLRATLAGPAKVRDRARVVGRQHADPVRLAHQERRDRVLVGIEQGPAGALADQPVLVVDQQRLAPAPFAPGARAASARSRR